MVSIRAWTPTPRSRSILATLPDEPVVLKQLVMQLFDELQKAKAALQRQEHHMHLLLRRLYGSTSEKFDPQQGAVVRSAARGRETGREQARAAGSDGVHDAAHCKPRSARTRPHSREVSA